MRRIYYDPPPHGDYILIVQIILINDDWHPCIVPHDGLDNVSDNGLDIVSADDPDDWDQDNVTAGGIDIDS